MPTRMICGGIYERALAGGGVQQGTLVSVTQDRDGETQGTVLFLGYAPETLEEEGETFQNLKLIGRPASPKIGRPKKE